MKYTLHMKDKSTHNLHTTQYQFDTILTELKGIDLNNIERVSFRETYIYSGKKLDILRERASMLSQCTSVGITIENVADYTFDLIMEGKLADVVSVCYSLQLSREFFRLETYMATDINLSDHLLRSNRFTGDFNTSLIIRFLSERNKMNYDDVFSYLTSSMPKANLRDFIPLVFKRLYGLKVEDVKVDRDGDKMSLKSINSDNLKKIDEELKTYFGGD